MKTSLTPTRAPDEIEAIDAPLPDDSMYSYQRQFLLDAMTHTNKALTALRDIERFSGMYFAPNNGQAYEPWEEKEIERINKDTREDWSSSLAGIEDALGNALYEMNLFAADYPHTIEHSHTFPPVKKPSPVCYVDFNPNNIYSYSIEFKAKA